MESPNLYWADGAGSRVVFDALQDLLAELRSIVFSDRAVALYRPRAGRADGYYVLSDSCDSTVEEALANEPLVLNQSIRLDEPSTVADLWGKSTLRAFVLGFVSALIFPWHDPFGRGAIIIGLQEEHIPESSLARLRGAADQQRLAALLAQSRMNGTLGLQRQLSAALRRALASADDEGGGTGRLASLVEATRALFQSDTAYLALPESPGGTRYFFASMSNIHTSPFRALRMEFGQGIGGYARTERRVVSSMKYSQDRRLREAPVQESSGEGLVSAMAAPLLVGSAVRGVLYVSSRRLRPFSPTDELVLEEFADYLSLLVDQPGFTAVTTAVQAERMREDFAHAIHDSVVRSLLQIGFTAEQAARTAAANTDRSSIELIRAAAAEALTNLREELSGLVAETSAKTMSLAEVLAAVADVPNPRGADREVVILGNAADTQMPSQVAEALIRIGAEALTNSSRHAEAKVQTVEASVVNNAIVLRILDDGRGSPLLGLTTRQLTAMGHLGIASMHRRAESIGAVLRIDSDVETGTAVTIDVPIG